ncbi:hypothetical protein BDW72DRAFT_199248 [Aspergillus terricola var. indicus]
MAVTQLQRCAYPRPFIPFFVAFITSFVLFQQVQAQDCSALNLCATGCCNKFGYCGVGDDYCGADCVSTCDYLSECDASRPCATGCCNKYGYCGLGPDYCADDVCVAGCESRSECDPGGYGEFADNAKCPLNVCCSKFGFCGTTKEFCGSRTVKRPSCSKENGMTRVVGYYEGWSMNRYCNSFYPEQIPIGVYTHLNYAFASIDPETFEVLAGSQREIEMMKRLTSLKESDPDLKVYVAIGGWTFNDPGPTATVFSDIARSEASQKAFFKSLISFMSTYDFDGVDLDWEYPVADDRSGRPEDFENFPKFMANLKKALKASGGRDGLSITLPASYWYLQHFDIVKLERSVDFFNIMSYDLHGAWDGHSDWVEPQLNSHTNLTEITNALDLLWRNNIKPDKVVLGIAFYARVFAASNPNCMEPGCLFQSGGNAGVCSNEVGILLNSEIIEIMEKQQIKSTFDKNAAVKILKFDQNQWLTYDDADTFKLKAQFASSQCLGGVMVWAVSHDLPGGNYSRALGEAANRKVTAIALPALSEDDVQTHTVNEQCKWTNCLDGCPSGWTHVRRSDDGSNGEAFIDHNDCPKGKDHFFCCPPDSPVPTCGWYHHRNGNCNGKDNCPAGMLEVGSNKNHCNSPTTNYEVACCTYEDIPSMRLYDQCDWNSGMGCDHEPCASGMPQVANSSTGSGGHFCRYRKSWQDWAGTYVEYQDRKYCCQQEENVEWVDCESHDAHGTLWLTEGEDMSNYCWSNCPGDSVRVSLHVTYPCDGGGRVDCCKPKYLTLNDHDAEWSDEMKELEQSLKEFLESPICPYDDEAYGFRRSWAIWPTGGNDSLDLFAGSSHSLHRRAASSKVRDDVHRILYTLVFVAVPGPTASQMMEMWILYVPSLYHNLTPSNIRDYATSWWDWATTTKHEFIEIVLCNMQYYNSILGKDTQEALDCECEPENCCLGDTCETYTDDGLPSQDDDEEEARLVARVSTREIKVPLPDGTVLECTVGDPLLTGFGTDQYTRRKNVEENANHPMRKKAYGFAQSGFCGSGKIGVLIIQQNTDVRDYNVEHKIELKTIGIWAENGAAGTLPSGKSPPNNLPPIPLAYVKTHLGGQVLPPATTPPMKGGRTGYIPINRIFNALGSSRNNEGFVLLKEGINAAKGKLWNDKYPSDTDETKDLAQKGDRTSAQEVLKRIRTVAAVISYLNYPANQAAMVQEAHEVEAEIRRADDAWVAGGNPQREIGVKWWRAIYKDQLEATGARARKVIDEWCDEMTKYWATRTGDTAMEVMQAVGTLRDSETVINQAGLGY